ncbi:MAG TPA: thioredoxin family protein, partial [Candidatus Polarisedimenticolaceae bacterium]|nr:thioredoxin family protein [Candidatus Polarisedimenticolaceae bacterium]
LAFMLGGTLSAVLLALPATGFAHGPAARRSTVAARVAPAVAVIGVGGFAVSVWLSGAITGESALPSSDDALPASDGVPARIGWVDFGQGLERAAEKDLPMVVVFVTSWCGYCKKMDRSTFRDPAVVGRLSRIVPVRVDAEETTARDGYRGVELAARYRVRGTPSLAVLDPRGGLIAQRSGYLAAGELLDWLDRVLPAPDTRRPEEATHVTVP